MKVFSLVFEKSKKLGLMKLMLNQFIDEGSTIK